MQTKDIQITIENLIECFVRIEQDIHDIENEKGFKSDYRTRDSVTYNLEKISKIVEKLPKAFKEKFPEINWKNLEGVFAIMGTYGINYSNLWHIASIDLPPIHKNLNKLSAHLMKNPSEALYPGNTNNKLLSKILGRK
jgi:uncharacterized protein with HEPN domain